jgi:hypothetical protein
MPTYTFRSNTNRPEGAIHSVELGLRVLASLKDMELAGIAAQYDWQAAEVGEDENGDYVMLEIIWPAETGFGAAREYIDRHFVTIEYPN